MTVGQRTPSMHARELSPAWRLAIFSGAVLTGLSASLKPSLAMMAIGLPVLLIFVIGFSETVLVLFLTAGVYKQDPLLMQYLPVDTTLLMGIFLLLATCIGVLRRAQRIPPALWLLVPTFLAIFVGLLRGPNEYGAEKAMRFCTLTLLGIVSGMTLLGERRSFERFLSSLALIAVFLSIYAAQSPETTPEGRLTLQGSNPISFGRIAALSMAFAWLRLHFTRRPFEVAVSFLVLAVSCYGVLAAGSRGPLISLLFSLALISVVTTRHHGRSPMSMRLVLLVLIFGVLAIALGSIPSMPLYRFQLLLSEDKGASILSRGILFTTAWNLMLTHPLGLGVGGFSKYAILDLHYPHNLLLEVGSELGWLPLLTLLILIFWDLRILVSILRSEYSWASLFLSVIVVSSLMNAMVSGDLNDNRFLFAVLLLPFVFRRIQQAAPGSSGPVLDSFSSRAPSVR